MYRRNDEINKHKCVNNFAFYDLTVHHAYVVNIATHQQIFDITNLFKYPRVTHTFVYFLPIDINIK